MRLAQIGDTIRTTSGTEFIVQSQEIVDGTQWVWSITDEEYEEEMMFSPVDYGVPATNFEIINRKNED